MSNPFWAIWMVGALLAFAFWVELTQRRRSGLKKLLAEYVERRKRDNLELAKSQKLLDETQKLASDARQAVRRRD